MQWASWVESTEDKPFTSWPGVPKPAPAGFSPWFPNNTADADSIGTNKWQPGMDRMWTHGVNLGQAMNVWGVMYRSTKDKAWIQRGKAGWDKIMQVRQSPTRSPPRSPPRSSADARPSRRSTTARPRA